MTLHGVGTDKKRKDWLSKEAAGGVMGVRDGNGAGTLDIVELRWN